MPLQQLVEYFNDRFVLEHNSSFRPIMLEEGLASGLFGPVRINSKFMPLRLANKAETISGYFAQLEVNTYDPPFLKTQQIERFMSGSETHASHFDSFINFDRLTRTVHMLNYLPISHLGKSLFVEVDPRHILSIKKDHGAYFEEIITKCGLQTQNVVIVTALKSYCTEYNAKLHQGLDNYRARGYKTGLRINYSHQDPLLLDFISLLAPNYVCVSTRNIEGAQNDALWPNKLRLIQSCVKSAGGGIVLLGVQEKKFAQLAIDYAVDLVEGNYYRAMAYDYRSHLKLESHNLTTISY
ncbi:MAG: hypothetical protein ABL903_13910 [Methylococcales bacterium]